MTPYELHILLHYYSCAGDYTGRGEPILEETLEHFVDIGMLRDRHEARGAIDANTARYEATDRLRCYARYICNLPLPEWSMLNTDTPSLLKPQAA